ncbi:response regulator [Treponema rectale]|uniref:CheY-like chemotaxis protein n=1 Tax=Treponema rectale TaxID=744512 RepID=A0A840SIX2_9SPIR|nr:response regulator [Treponema rectale]MBB5219332.1 CheY-like chemotaxis protein [Treponema rectale]QOS40785.1 response regulator [Treponema rectale]
MSFHRILITGTNKPLINDFFKQGREFFELLTSSMRGDDLDAHLRLTQPEALICCLNIEKDTELHDLNSFVNVITKKNIPVIILGTKEGVNRYKGFITQSPTYAFDEKYIPPRTMFLQIVKIIEKGTEAPDESEKKHVLVVDDDPLILKVIKETLHDDYDVAVSVGGKTALKFLETKTTDLILLDYEMPELNGVQVLERLRMDPKTESIPVIFLTGNRDPQKVKEVLSFKPKGYILKPVNAEKLKETIKKILV